MNLGGFSGKFKRFQSFQRLHSTTLNGIGPFRNKLENLLFPKPVVIG